MNRSTNQSGYQKVSKRIRSTSQSSSSLAEETAPRKPSEYLFAVFFAVCLIGALQWVMSKQSDELEPPPKSFDYLQVSNEKIAPSELLLILMGKLTTQYPEQGVQSANDDLLTIASEAVAQENDAQFAETMMMLGVNAIRDDDTESAGVYLEEALSVYEELESELGIANVELLRGELNIKVRSEARRAAYAYDAMQLGRWKVANGQFHEALDELKFAVNENLALKRYGAAAAVYQTLYKGYTAHGQNYQAQLAGIEIVKLHASSGRPLQANAMIATLQANGLDSASADQLKRDNAALQVEFESSVGQLGQARDYQQLYNHFIHAGDPVRAWQFRLKAQRSLRGVSKRAMHRSQTGVLALLYTSNDHMVKAERSLTRARALFSSNDHPELSQASALLQNEVY